MRTSQGQAPWGERGSPTHPSTQEEEKSSAERRLGFHLQGSSVSLY